MFFERIGRFATRFRLFIIAGWIAGAVLVTLIAPHIEEVASSDTADFLPSNAPFAHAEAVYKNTFPDDFAPSSTVIVIDARQAAGGILNPAGATFEDQIDTETGRFLNELGAWLTGPDAPPGIQSVTLPTTSPTLAALLVASDQGEDPTLSNKVALVHINLTASSTEDITIQALKKIDSWLEEHRPDDVRTYQTGAAPIVSDTTESVKTSADRTIWVTVVLVIIMLLLVYRSPVSPLIPLVSVTLAYLITRGIVAYLGDHYMTITSYANILLVVVMYGAGTDYCLFLISRFREEMADLPEVESATVHTVHRVGETITSSAGTIFVGFMAMIFAEMGIFNTSGPALAVGIVISLASGLTLVPALLATLGDHAFWPNRATHRANGRLYELTSKWVSARPLTVILTIVSIMAPFSIYGVLQPVSYDILGDLPDDKPAVVGFNLMKESLGAGAVMPLTVVLTGQDAQQVAADIVHLSDDLSALKGVQDVRSLDDPLGQRNSAYSNLLQVGGQLDLALTMLNSTSEGQQTVDMSTLAGVLSGMKTYLDLLAQQFPQVANDPNLLTLQDMLDHPLQLATRQEDFKAALEGLKTAFETVTDPYLMPSALKDVFSALPESATGFSADMFDQLSTTYLANEGTAFKIDVVLHDSSTSTKGMDTLTAIRRLLKRYQGSGDAVASGGAAINTDIRDTMNRDLLRAIGFVLFGIFLVLLLMLHSVVAPLYLIMTVVLSFTFTLGVTNLLLKNLLGIAGLTWYVPFFAFVFLVALGIDYSIFLFGRIKEEVGNHGLREGVHVAVATTGAIITSAGMILSGTFATMVTGEVAGLIEMGFAVAFGVLIDTFVVRTMLDPALATLFGKGTWWPGGVPKAQKARTSVKPE